MSFDALRWAAGLKVGSSAGRSVLWALADAADNENKCFKGQDTLAVVADVSARSVFTWLDEFERRGWIERKRRQRKTGSRTSDEIVLMIPNQLATIASRKRGKATTQLATIASSQLASISEVTRNGCEALILEDKSKPLTPFTVTEANMAIRDILTDIGVSEETAEALMARFAFTGSPLDLDGSNALAKQLDGPDPQSAALAYLEDGLWRTGAGGRRGARFRNSTGAAGPQRRVNPNTEPDLWRRCCEAVGHSISLTGKDGGWSFDIALIERVSAATDAR